MAYTRPSVTFLRQHRALIVILLLTAAVFTPSLKNGFVNLDDPMLVSENRHVQEASVANILYVFTHFDPELYIPFTFLSYQLETWALGPAAWHYHFFNILLHLGSVILLYGIILRLSSRRDLAVIVTALFALHPINAEAVLWISGRKDLLSALFVFASLAAYMRTDDRHGTRWYAASIAFFFLSLGSKVGTVSFPVALLLLEIWKGTERKHLVKKVAPFFALSFVFGIVALSGKTEAASVWDPIAFVFMAFRSTAFYLQLMLIPAGFAVSHSHPAIEAYAPVALLAVGIIAMVSCVVWTMRQRFPLAPMGWIFFLVMIAPSWLQYTHGNEDVILGSERYAYLPSVGIFLIIGTALVALHAFITTRVLRISAATAACCILLVLGYLTVLRTFVFEDSIIFNLDILQKSPTDARARYNLGVALEAAKRPMEAESAYALALQAKPDFANAAISLGIMFLKEGRTGEALAMFHHATEIRPDYFKTHFSLGLAYQQLGRWDDAIDAYKKTEMIFPDYPQLHKNLATVYGQKKMFAEALRHYEILATIDPGFRKEYETIKASVR